METPTIDHAGLEFLLGHVIQDFMGFMKQNGLSMPQVHVLMHLFHAGECQVSEVGGHMQASPAAASQLVERLVQQGLVERREDPDNRRVKKLRLTAKGLQLIRQGILSNPTLEEVFSSLTEEQRLAIHTAFAYLAQAVQQIQSTHHTQKDFNHAHHWEPE